MDSKLCTWHNGTTRCDTRATHPYHDAAGRVWANLCGIHSLQLDTALASTNSRALLSAWVKASGGADKLADSMNPASTFGSATKEPTGEDL